MTRIVKLRPEQQRYDEIYTALQRYGTMGENEDLVQKNAILASLQAGHETFKEIADVRQGSGVVDTMKKMTSSYA